LPARDGRALGFLERYAEVLDRRFENGRAVVEVRIAPGALGRLHNIAPDVQGTPTVDEDRPIHR